MKEWKTFRYKKSLLFLCSIAFAVILFRYEPFHELLLGLGNAGYVGAFLAGMLFVLSFTVASAMVILLVLAEKLSPIEIGLLAGLGAVVGDYIIFRFIKDDFSEEVTPLYNKLGGKRLTSLLKTKYFSWTLPIIGAIIIASPFPDEIGVTLMGVSQMKKYQFIVLSFLLNSVGIYIFITAASGIKP